MRKIYLLLLFSMHCFTAKAQTTTPARLDSISQALNQQLGGGPATPLQRVVLVRQQLEAAVLDQQWQQIPLLLDYLALAVPQSVPTVQPGEAMSLLLAAGAFGPLLKRVVADQAEPVKARYGSAGLLPPTLLADVADFYSGTHVEVLTTQAQALPAEESRFVRLLLEVLPRGGVSPDLDSTIRQFQWRYPSSRYGSVLKNFQAREQVKAQLRKWHEREESEKRKRWENEWQQQRSTAPSTLESHVDGYLNLGTGYFFGSLGQAFRQRYNFGLGSELCLHRYVLGLRVHFGGVEVRENFTNNGIVYPAGSISLTNPEVSVGYQLLQTKKVSLSPFIGVSLYHFTFPEQVPGTGRNGKVQVYLNRPLLAGLVFDYSPNKESASMNWVLKLHSGLRAAQLPDRPDVSGMIFYLNVGVGYRVH